MVAIPAGIFLMGTRDESASADESPAHEVRLKAFWMSKCEVPWKVLWVMRNDARGEAGTNKNARAAKEAAPLAIPFSFTNVPDRTGNKLESQPIAGLTQYGAERLCLWLSARTGRKYRLPTEAEWEYAARAGTTTARYFGNNDKNIDKYAWFNGKLADGSHPVGQKKPNAWGLCDMYGNVAEWTLDGWSDDYRAILRSKFDPWVPRKPQERFGVVRGGDWTSPPTSLRSAARAKHYDFHSDSGENEPEWYDTSDDGIRVGIRLVSPTEPDKEAEGHPNRADYLKPYGWDDWMRGHPIKK